MTKLSPHDPQIDLLWRGLVAAGARSVAVVSAGAGEGTTLIAAALARRAALEGRRPLLVDLNRARPMLGHMLGLRSQPGEVVTMPGQGVAVLAQPATADLNAWHDSSALAAYAGAVSAKHDIVIYDTAPVLARDDATPRGATVAAAADSTVLVVQSGTTSAQAQRDARSRLIVAGARLVATVTSERDKVHLLTRLEVKPVRSAPKPGKAVSGLLAAAGGRLAALSPARLMGMLPLPAR